MKHPLENAPRHIAPDEKWVFEVRGGLIQGVGGSFVQDAAQTDLPDGWWFSTMEDVFGPFATQLDAFLANRSEPFPL